MLLLLLLLFLLLLLLLLPELLPIDLPPIPPLPELPRAIPKQLETVVGVVAAVAPVPDDGRFSGKMILLLGVEGPSPPPRDLVLLPDPPAEPTFLAASRYASSARAPAPFDSTRDEEVRELLVLDLRTNPTLSSSDLLPFALLLEAPPIVR